LRHVAAERTAAQNVRQYAASLDRETWLHPFLMDDAFGPYERLGFFVMAREEGLGNGNEFAHASKPSPF
jgi:hypothetical protein